MANSPAFAAPKSTGDQVQASEFDALDTGQQNAMTRSGTTALTGTSTWQGGGQLWGFDFHDNAASQGVITIGAQDFTFVITGAGLLKVQASAFSLTGTGWPALGARAVTELCPGAAWSYNGTIWTNGGSVGGGSLDGVSTISTSAGTAAATLSGLPVAMTITSVEIEYIGATTGALPATMPIFTLYRYAKGAYGSPTQTVGTVTDPSPDNATYTANHTVTIGSLFHVVLSTSRYVLAVGGPAGANNAVGSSVHRIFVTGSLNTLRTA